MRLFFAFLLTLAVPVTKAADFFLINEPIPETVKHLSSTIQLPSNQHAYKTALGVTSHCYKGNHFLILSENKLGKGYEFTLNEPENAQCILMGDNINPVQNQAGMHLGMIKSKIIETLKMPQSSDAATLLYNREVVLDGNKFDEQTWIDVEFSDNKLILLKVFTSLTN